MRKVTASAVILTALTGCSQNSVPSTQWSFEVPDGNQAAGFQRTAEGSPSSSFASEISASALTDSLQSQTGAMMGPAFEQPNTSSANGIRRDAAPSAAEALASGDLSSLVTTATNPRSNAFIRATADRPDPIAQARSYLNRSSRPTAVINRVPYTSQVYLPSTPVAAPLSALGTIPAAPIAPSVVSPQLVPQLTAQGTTQPVVQSTRNIAAAPTLGATATTSGIDVFRPDSVPSLYQEVAANAGMLLDSNRSASETAANAPIIDDGLPVLSSSETSSSETIASRQPVDSQPGIAVDETIPIGTSILQELQREGINAAKPESAPSVTAQSIAVQPSTQPEALTVTATQSENTPTLARLLAGLPLQEQEPSPSITSLRQPTESLQTRETIDGQIAENQVAENQTTYNSSESSLSLSDQTGANSTEQSPLLSGLDNVEPAASTIYVPIPAETAVDMSASFIQAAIAALEKEASAVAFNLEASEAQGILSIETLELLRQEADTQAIELQNIEFQETELQGTEHQDVDRLARLLSLIRTPHRIPSVVQDANALPAEAVSDENLQASAAKHSPNPVTTAPAKRSVRKYRQRISWNDSAI